MKSAVIVDTAAYLPEELLKHPDLYVVDITLNFEDGTSYPDTADIEILREFFKKLEHTEKLPSTSQPMIGEYIDLLEHLINQGYEQIFSVHLSSGISGAYATAHQLLESVNDRVKTYCIDSKAASVVMVEIIKEIFQELAEGRSGDEIFENVKWMANHSEIYLKVEKLDNLIKGGRVNPALGKIAGALRVRPVLYFDDEGKIVLYENMRSDKIVYKRWAKLAQEAIDKYGDQLIIAFAHADAPEALEEAQKCLNEKTNYSKPYVEGVLGSAVANYTAQGSLGCGFIPLPVKRLQNQ